MPCSSLGLPGARERERFQRLRWHEMAIKNRQWILARRPVGEIRDGDLLLKTPSLPVVGPGELLVRTPYLSLDPTTGSDVVFSSKSPSRISPTGLRARIHWRLSIAISSPQSLESQLQFGVASSAYRRSYQWARGSAGSLQRLVAHPF